MIRKPYVIILALLLVACFSCASFMRTSHNTLSAAAITVDTAMKVCEDLHREGYINDNDVEKIKALHRKFRAAYMVAVDALAAYQISQTTDTQQRLTVALTQVNGVVADIMSLTREFSSRKGGLAYGPELAVHNRCS